MRIIKHIIFGTAVAVLIDSCKKDTITTATIHGQVYNLCTDSGLANITVYLSTSGAALNPATTLSTVSGANGSFSFTNAQIHSSSDYSYSLNIPSVSGIGGYGVGFYAGEWILDKSKLNTQFVLGVIPCFANLKVKVNPAVTFVSPDTVTLTFTQKIYHSNVPNNPYQLIATSYDFGPGYPTYSQTSFGGGYVMGLWNITINKTKSGVNTIKNDSIYLSYGAAVTYTFSF